MTKIDFYVLADGSPQARELFACRLVDKAQQLGNRIYIHTSNEAQSRAIDKLLWTFKRDSFIPHAIDGEAPDADATALIGHQPQLNDPTQAHRRNVLINLSLEVPLFFSSFERTAEIIDPNEQNKEAGRNRFRFYRDRGYELKTHNIK